MMVAAVIRLRASCCCGVTGAVVVDVVAVVMIE